MYREKRDRLLESLSLGSRKCPECNVFGTFYLVEREPVLISCQHCEGEWSLKEDKYTPSLVCSFRRRDVMVIIW